VPLAHPPGHAQVDFGGAIAIVGGVRMKVHYFCIELPQSDGCFVKAGLGEGSRRQEIRVRRLPQRVHAVQLVPAERRTFPKLALFVRMRSLGGLLSTDFFMHLFLIFRELHLVAPRREFVPFSVLVRGVGVIHVAARSRK
jgi:hypothetical protein